MTIPEERVTLCQPFALQSREWVEFGMPLRRNQLATWVAILAMALNALWPLISQAQPGEQKLYGTVCSVQGGVQTIELPGGKAPSDDGAGKHQQHCKLCVVGSDRLQALPSVHSFTFQTAAFVADAPAGHYTAGFNSTFDSPAQPRAPPSHL